MKKRYKFLSLMLTISLLFTAVMLSSCEDGSATGIGVIDDFISVFKGGLVGNDYYISEYDNYGNKLVGMQGTKVDITAETDSYGEISSYLDITIDGRQWQHVGNTMIFAQKGLDMLDVELPEDFGTHWQMSKGLMAVDGFVNDIRDMAGKPRLVVVYSQLGNPIGVFQGDSCKVTIPGGLPKMTRVNIDGKSLYIYKANIDVYDLELIQ